MSITPEETIKILTAKAECMRRETSGIDIDCNYRNCDECDLCYKQGTTGDQMEALRVAISALQAQDVPDTNVGDMISRQKAIDALCRRCDLVSDDEPCTDECNDIKILKMLPSAQPERKIGKFVRWMEKREMPDCISYTPHCKCSLCGNELFIENINYCYMCGARLVEDRGAERREE